MVTAPTVSIVIPAYNEEAKLERCLRAAINQTVPAMEIIVVDNLSTDATNHIAKRLAREHPAAGIRVIEQTAEQGITPTRNAGFAAARGEVIGRIDADSIIAPDWIARVLAALTPTIAAVTGPVTYYDLPFRSAQGMSDDIARRTLRRLGKAYPFLFGCNMAIRASAWRAIEQHTCLDHEDLLHEDIDLAVHLHDAGHLVGYAPRMRAAVSARRLSSSPAAFRSYTDRFTRTYASHQLDRLWHLKAPQVLLRSVYWWSRLLGSLVPAGRPAMSAA
jgi:glycosyltransferase involved in cell wall biosynthesis